MKNQTYFISAGELSGDLLAAELVLSIDKKSNGKLSGFGLTGDHMRKVGVVSVADNANLATFGLTGILNKISDYRRLEYRLLQMIDIMQPKFAILVDFPGFHFRLAELLRLRQIPVFQYVAPKLWAWGRSRVSKLRDNFDMVLGVLPFEEKFFLENNVNYKFIGSPHTDRIQDLITKYGPIKKGSIKPKNIVLGLPGSRMNEVSNLLGHIINIKKIYSKEYSNNEIEWVVPVADSICFESLRNKLSSSFELISSSEADFQCLKLNFVHDNCKKSLKNSFVIDNILFVEGQSFEWLYIADYAVAASGTVTLEAALLEVPCVVIYSMGDFSYELAKSFVTVKYISLPNLIQNKEVFPEHIQNIDYKKVIKSLMTHMQSDSTLRDDFLEIKNKLVGGASNKAADIILSLVE